MATLNCKRGISEVVTARLVTYKTLDAPTCLLGIRSLHRSLEPLFEETAPMASWLLAYWLVTIITRPSELGHLPTSLRPIYVNSFTPILPSIDARSRWKPSNHFFVVACLPSTGYSTLVFAIACLPGIYHYVVLSRYKLLTNKVGISQPPRHPTTS
ncbi:hypothetical protein FRC02_001341 [Tulasnella sp. 418]|nr:hypothetical protein FRC02_001341 [Tulasnella sp. 418]